MNIVVLGLPASGKGTQAELLAKKLGLYYLEMGEVLREIAKEKTPLGKEVNRIVYQEGGLVPDKAMRQIVGKILAGIKFDKGIVFDGYPRKLSQYQDLEKMLANRGNKIDRVFFLKVSQETIIKRISSRRVCPRCDSEYNLITRPPKKGELCDQCQVKLIQRQDDKPEIVKKRLETYRRLTIPMIEYVRQQGILEEIDGERSIEVIYQDLLGRLKQ